MKEPGSENFRVFLLGAISYQLSVFVKHVSSGNGAFVLQANDGMV
jgi:hypothetical protein